VADQPVEVSAFASGLLKRSPQNALMAFAFLLVSTAASCADGVRFSA